MSDDRSINAQISELRQSFENGSITGERFYDLKHVLLMRLKEPPQAARAHEDTRVCVGAFYYYKDAVTKRLFRTSLDGRIYLDDELKQLAKEQQSKHQSKQQSKQQSKHQSKHQSKRQ
jgi:hypothetical protein